MYEEGFLKVVDRSSLDTDLGKMEIDFVLDPDLVLYLLCVGISPHWCLVWERDTVEVICGIRVLQQAPSN